MPSNSNAAKKTTAKPGKQRRQAAMPSPAAPPPPPPPAATTTAQQRATGQPPAPPKPDQQATQPDPAPQAPPPAAEATAPQQAQDQPPAPPEPQPGNGLEKSLGISLGNLAPSTLGSEIPREIPRDSPRTESGIGYGSVLPPLRPRTDPAARREKVRGQSSHPRQEPGQLNPGVRRFNANAVRMYADERAIKLGAALDEIIETGMRLLAPDVIAEEYAERCRALGVPNDWHDTRRELLADILRQVPPQMVVEVYQELTQQSDHE